MNRPSALLLLALPLCLEACASPGDYPSLSKSENERVTGTAEPAAPGSLPPEAPPAPTTLHANVEQLLEQAKSAHGAFAAKRAKMQRAVRQGSGAARASEGWVAAQVALAELEAARSDAVTSLAEIDRLYADERVARPEAISPSTAVLESAREQVEAWVEEENGVIEQLTSQFGS